MMADRTRDGEPDGDDEALSWAGDESPAPVKPRRAADPVDVIVADEPAETAAEPQPVAERASSVLLVASGVLGGIYLLFTIGWVVTAQTEPALDGLARVMYVLGQWLAVAAPALWFGATLLLTRHRPTPVKLLWLVIGMLLLVPWPFILNR
jgi:hypothetical protein